jgi:hypothetical protein
LSWGSGRWFFHVYSRQSFSGVGEHCARRPQWRGPARASALGSSSALQMFPGVEEHCAPASFARFNPFVTEHVYIRPAKRICCCLPHNGARKIVDSAKSLDGYALEHLRFKKKSEKYFHNNFGDETSDPSWKNSDQTCIADISTTPGWKIPKVSANNMYASSPIECRRI